MVIDVISYNGEKELFDIRYQVLKDFVDEFRVIEFDKTFSGKEKGMLFSESGYYGMPKVRHYWVQTWGSYKDLAISSPNTEYGKGAKHWITEFCQKESIKDCLTDLKDSDLVFIGDCDEIWEPGLVFKAYEKPSKLKLRVYSYWLNNRSSEQFWGTLMAQYKDIKNECLNHLRANAEKTPHYLGWHFTSMGGYESVRNKLTDSYTDESYANPAVMDNLYDNLAQNRDFLGRNFTYRTDETELPQYLKENKDKYKHLLRP